MPTTGTHTELRIDLEPRDVLATLAPLVLRERGAPEAPDALRMVALVKRSRSDAPLDPLEWETADARVFLLTHWHTWRLDVQGPPVVPDLPTQAEYVLALSRADGWYARTTLLHDGTPRDVELSPPARLVAHIVDEAGRGVAGANVRIEFDGVTGLSEEAVVWNCTPTTSGHDGQVELVAPTRVHPIDPEELESMPHVCRVSIAAQSYAPLSVDVPLHPGVTRDLGPLVLRARQPDIVVEFPGDVSELSGAHWELEGVVQYQVIVRTRARDANTLEAEFETHGVEPPKVERLVLYDTDGGAVTARRAGDRYVVEESRALRCTLDTSALDPPPYYLQVGARWGAVTWHVTGSSRSNVLAAEHSIDQVVPAEGVELFWREMDDEQQFGPAHPLPWPTPGETLRLAR